MKPNESLLKTHLLGAPFLAGVDAGKWGLHGALEPTDLNCPIIWVRGDKRFIASGRVYLRFDTAGYSHQAPTACPWDIERNAKLAPGLWPKGDGVSLVFNPAWRDHALYAPCDRLAMDGHDSWRSQSPQWWWQPSFTIVKYLEFVYVCLNPADYAN